MTIRSMSPSGNAEEVDSAPPPITREAAMHALEVLRRAWGAPSGSLALPQRHIVVSLEAHSTVTPDVQVSGTSWHLEFGVDALPTWLDPRTAEVLGEFEEGSETVARTRVGTTTYSIHKSDGWPSRITTRSTEGAEETLWLEAWPVWSKQEWKDAIASLFTSELADPDREVADPVETGAVVLGEALAALDSAYPRFRFDSARLASAAHMLAVAVWSTGASREALRAQIAAHHEARSAVEFGSRAAIGGRHVDSLLSAVTNRVSTWESTYRDAMRAHLLRALDDLVNPMLVPR
jgi:hypothetical protein